MLVSTLFSYKVPSREGPQSKQDVFHQLQRFLHRPRGPGRPRGSGRLYGRLPRLWRPQYAPQGGCEGPRRGPCGAQEGQEGEGAWRPQEGAQRVDSLHHARPLCAGAPGRGGQEALAQGGHPDGLCAEGGGPHGLCDGRADCLRLPDLALEPPCGLQAGEGGQEQAGEGRRRLL